MVSTADRAHRHRGMPIEYTDTIVCTAGRVHRYGYLKLIKYTDTMVHTADKVQLHRHHGTYS